MNTTRFLLPLPWPAFLSLLFSTVLGGCANLSGTPGAGASPVILSDAVREALAAPAPRAASVAASVAPPAARDTLPVADKAPDWKTKVLVPARGEQRFSLVLNGASPEVLFMALLSDTALSVAVDPAIKGPMSVTLKDVTLREALDLLSELHGLEYKVIGRHILVGPAALQTQILTVDYPVFNRSGRSDLRVVSGGITGSGGGSPAGASSPAAGNGNSGAATGNTPESSRVTTSQKSDLWGEIESTVKLLIGDKDGRSVIVSPQTSNIVVRALPKEIRAVERFLNATRASVERQVMLEAKVVEVQLSNSERSGINWAAFKAGLSLQATAGVVGGGSSLAPTGSLAGNLISVVPGAALSSAAAGVNALLGLAFQTSNFAAVLEFLNTQGNIQVLSSPRIATMNNQKAVLKVGTDDFFVTNISTTTSAVGNGSTSSPTISVQPFFSGISLDVTPNINAEGFITLHVHPAVSTVTERNKVLNLGSLGSFTLPLASSDVNETDAVVRARDGNIIAIGGLMRQASASSDSGIPGVEGVLRKLLGGQTTRLSEKRELVILLKPTIIDPHVEDSDLRRDALARLLDWTAAQPPHKASTTPLVPGVKTP